MAAKEIKACLKCARESIQNKDFQSVLKHCKSVLKLDGENYNAFVFVGVASLELGKPEQARAAYKKAIGINAENILAWQGLASLYEREKSFDKEDVVEVHEQLLQRSSDKSKCRESLIKLITLYEQLGYNKKLIGAYETLLQDENLMIVNEENCGYFKKYINLMIQSVDRHTLESKVISEAVRMSGFFKDDVFPWEILAKICLEKTSSFSFSTSQDTDALIDELTVYQNLSMLAQDSALAQLGFGKVKLLQENVSGAEKHLQTALQSLTKSLFGWFYLAKVQLFSRNYVIGAESAAKALLYLGKEKLIFVEFRAIQYEMILCRARACCMLGTEEMSTAVEYYNKLMKLQSNNAEILGEFGRLLLKLDQLEPAKECLEKFRNLSDCEATILALEGEILTAENDYENAEKRFTRLLELQPENSLCYFNLAKLYWLMGDEYRTDKEKCLACLLKAAKLDPFNSQIFLYLGHYYKSIRVDLSKACRCYKKAHVLRPFCNEIAEALGDMYITLGQEENAVQLYKRFTSRFGRAKWAWLRLGLYNLKHEHHNEAVQCLQNASRIDETDANCWECLGEAYMNRGSYLGALSSFTKAVELDKTLLYSRYQIASVKHVLHLLDEAVLDFKEILSEHCDYVPSLKGIGETYLSYVRKSLSKDFHSKAVDYIQAGIVVTARAIECDAKLSCLWKLLGDICSCVRKIHPSKISLDVPKSLRKFLNLTTETTIIDKREALQLATSTYEQAVRYNPNCSGLWHDLGLSCFQLLQLIQNVEERERLSQRALKALKKALNLDADNYNVWNSLGVVAMSKEINNPELSQHAFIKSILCQKTATAWSNLGVLYLTHGKVEMANNAFNKAQCTDSTYTQAWVGQAMIAEMVANEESMDLFRHSIELGSHLEGYLGYAHWVCQKLSGLSENVSQIKNEPFADISHLPKRYRTIVISASDAVGKYIDQVNDNACAYNMYGGLLEHQKLYKQAERAYILSLQLLEADSESSECYKNTVRANLARVTCMLGKYTKSIKMYQEITPLDNFYHVTGLALTFFKAGMLPESFKAYEQAFELAANDGQKSHIRAAMGMLGYALKDIPGCKQILYESSSEFQSSCEEGLLALSAVGLITSDLAVAAAALSELVKIGQDGDDKLIAQACYLFATFYALQGDANLGKNYIISEIHRRPCNSLLWSKLATFLLRFQRSKFKETGRCAEAVHKLGDKNVEGISTIMSYCAVGSGSRINGDDLVKNGLRTAQKSVHTKPDDLTNWSLLAAALSDSLSGQRSRRVDVCEKVTYYALTKAIRNSEESEDTTGNKREVDIMKSSQKWLALQYGYCLFYNQKTGEALDHCQQALQIWQSDSVFTARIQLLVVEIKCGSKEITNSTILEDLLTVLTLNDDICYAWLFAAMFHERYGFVKAAEYCYRSCLQVASRQGSLHGKIVSLTRLAHLALRQSMRDSEKSNWIQLIFEASTEVLKSCPGSETALLLQGIAHYMNNHIRQAKDVLANVKSPECADVANFYLVLLHMKKRDKGETLEDVVKKSLSNNVCGSLQDMLLYFLASHFDNIERKRLLLECVHLNPSELRYWYALNNA